ncbi:MAG TPA: hypothetical protein VK832_11055 [Burkholderiaceae bacterium]|nr:hypothetical protein [Burkholderiaceae bacterium]
MVEQTENTLLLDIEKRLDADITGDVKRQYLHVLESLRLRLQLQLQLLSAPQTFREIAASLQAVDGAMLALRSISPKRKSGPPPLERSVFSISAFIK